MGFTSHDMEDRTPLDESGTTPGAKRSRFMTWLKHLGEMEVMKYSQYENNLGVIAGKKIASALSK